MTSKTPAADPGTRIETDTFGAASIVLAEYDLQDQAFAINKRAAELAREMADAYSTLEKPRFVAGSMGPTTKLPTLGHIDFDTMKASFAEQAEGLEQLRALEHGYRIKVVEVESASWGIDTPADLERYMSVLNGTRTHG